MLCVEMALMAILHILAYPAAPYNTRSKEYLDLTEGKEPEPRRYHGGFLGFKAVLDASNPWDQIKAMGRALRWLFFSKKDRENDSSYGVRPSPSLPEGLRSLARANSADHGSGSPGKKPAYSGLFYEEDLGLLPNTHSFGVFSSEIARADSSPYRYDSDKYDRGAGTIGVARSTDRPHQAWNSAYTSIPNPQVPTHAENQEPGSYPEYL